MADACAASQQLSFHCRVVGRSAFVGRAGRDCASLVFSTYYLETVGVPF